MIPPSIFAIRDEYLQGSITVENGASMLQISKTTFLRWVKEEKSTEIV